MRRERATPTTLPGDVPRQRRANRGDKIEDDEIVDPGWAFGHTVGLTGTVPVHVEIWDHDGDDDDVSHARR